MSRGSQWHANDVWAGGVGDDDDNGDSIIQNLDNYELILKTTVHKSVDMDVPSHILHLEQKSFETFFYL